MQYVEIKWTDVDSRWKKIYLCFISKWCVMIHDKAGYKTIPLDYWSIWSRLKKSEVASSAYLPGNSPKDRHTPRVDGGRCKVLKLLQYLSHLLALVRLFQCFIDRESSTACCPRHYSLTALHYPNMHKSRHKYFCNITISFYDFCTDFSTKLGIQFSAVLLCCKTVMYKLQYIY